jgi:flagellar basal-body rod protein FlgB
MKIDAFQDQTLNAMGNYLTRLSKRQQVVSSNIANIDTPGFKTKEISFHATLRELVSTDTEPLRTSRPEHLAMGEWSFVPLEPEIYEVGGLPARADRNNVDIDKEMLKLSETSIAFGVIAQLLRVKFKTIASSINEGRG